MKNILAFIGFLVLLTGCRTLTKATAEKIQLKFLDEYVVSQNLTVNETLVGGLSGIDYANGKYYLISDDASNPRYYEARIKINKSKIDTIVFAKTVKFKDSLNYLDVEAIRYDERLGQVVITSEGSVNLKKDPSLFSVDSNGIIEKYFEIPSALNANSKEQPRNNGTLEGLTLDHNKQGYWIAMELPLKADGPEPKVSETKSPVRITYIDAKTQKPTKQFAYLLDKIDKIPKGNFAVNGLTDLIAYEKNHFMVIERSFSSGLGVLGNTIKIFKIDATKASNTLGIGALDNTNYTLANKELLFDFESVREGLTNKSIDNIEGITFGPTLANGNRTLILVADNNFNKLGPQLNQFILMEILNYKE